MNDSKPEAVDTASLLRQVCQSLDDKKAVDLKVMRVSEQSSITDYLVLATGTSEPHLRALRVEIEKVIDSTGTRILGMDTGTESGWTVVDAVDLMVHVFTPENREKYALENLWKDAEEVSLEEVYLGVKPKAKTGAVKEAKSSKPAKAPKAKKPAKAGKAKPAAKSGNRTAVKKKSATKASKKAPSKKTAAKKKR